MAAQEIGSSERAGARLPGPPVRRGLVFILPALSAYEFVRRVPQRVRISLDEAMALCRLSEDLRAHLFSHHPALLDRLLPEHRQMVLESIRGISRSEQIPAVSEPSVVQDRIGASFDEPEAAIAAVGPLDHTIILAETLQEVHEDSARLSADLRSALSARDRDRVKNLLEGSIWSKWFLSHVLEPFVDKFAAEIAALGVDPELVRTQAASHEQARGRGKGGYAENSLEGQPAAGAVVANVPAEDPGNRGAHAAAVPRPPSLPRSLPSAGGAGSVLGALAGERSRATVEAAQTTPAAPPPTMDIRAGWARTITLGTFVSTAEGMLAITTKQMNEQRTARQCALGYQNLFSVIDAIERAVAADLATIGVHFPRPRDPNNAGITGAHRHPLAELFTAVTKNRRTLVSFLVEAQATSMIPSHDPLRMEFEGDVAAFGLLVQVPIREPEAAGAHDPADAAPSPAPIAHPQLGLGSHADVPPAGTEPPTPVAEPAAGPAEAPPGSDPGTPTGQPAAQSVAPAPPVQPVELAVASRAPLSSGGSPGQSGRASWRSWLVGAVGSRLRGKLVRRGGSSAAAREERRTKAIRRALVKAARLPTSKVQTAVDHGTGGLFRWSGWAVVFFFGGACYYAAEERLPIFANSPGNVTASAPWKAVTPNAKDVPAFLTADQALDGHGDSGMVPVLKSGAVFEVVEDRGAVLAISVVPKIGKPPIKIWVRRDSVARVK